jgi:hypothetical protein
LTFSCSLLVWEGDLVWHTKSIGNKECYSIYRQSIHSNWDSNIKYSPGCWRMVVSSKDLKNLKVRIWKNSILKIWFVLKWLIPYQLLQKIGIVRVFPKKKSPITKKNYGATNFSVFHDFFIIPSEFLTYPKIKNPRTIRLVWLIF